MSIDLNQPIPPFIAQATSDLSVDSEQLRGQHFVLYFYPKDNTPGCTTEGQDFRTHHGEFAAANTRIFGVSRDSLRTHENFRRKQDFPFELISDADDTLCRLFDVIKLKQMYGKEYEGIERSTFLVDAEGVLRAEWRKVKVKNHVLEVLEAARQLPG